MALTEQQGPCAAEEVLSAGRQGAHSGAPASTALPSAALRVNRASRAGLQTRQRPLQQPLMPFFVAAE